MPKANLAREQNCTCILILTWFIQKAYDYLIIDITCSASLRFITSFSNEDSKLRIHRINAGFHQNDIGILLTNHSERFKTTLRHGLSRDTPSLDEKENLPQTITAIYVLMKGGAPLASNKKSTRNLLRKSLNTNANDGGRQS